MSADLLMAYDAEVGAADLVLAGADLAGDDGLQAAIVISLFTDRRAAADDLPPGETSRRGWWGDALEEEPGEGMGSLLWLLEREKEGPEALAKAEAYAADALAWMTADGVVTAVQVQASWFARGALALLVMLTLPDGTAREYQFQYVFGGA